MSETSPHDPQRGMLAVRCIERALARSITAGDTPSKHRHLMHAQQRLQAFKPLLDAHDTYERKVWRMGSTSVEAVRRHAARLTRPLNHDDAAADAGALHPSPEEALDAEADANRAIAEGLLAKGPWRLRIKRRFETSIWLTAAEIALDGPAGPHTLYAWSAGVASGPMAIDDAVFSWAPSPTRNPQRPAIGGGLTARGSQGRCVIPASMLTLEPGGETIGPIAAQPGGWEGPLPWPATGLVQGLNQIAAEAVAAGDALHSQARLSQLKAAAHAFRGAARVAFPPRGRGGWPDPIAPLEALVKARWEERLAARLFERAVHQAAHFVVSYQIFSDPEDDRWPTTTTSDAPDLTGALPSFCQRLDPAPGDDVAALAGIIAEAWARGGAEPLSQDCRACYAIAREIVGSDDPTQLPFTEAAQRARDRWPTILMVAGLLIDRGHIDALTLSAYIDEAVGGWGRPDERGAVWMVETQARLPALIHQINTHATWDYQVAASPTGWPGLNLAIEGSNDFIYYTSTVMRAWGVYGARITNAFSHAVYTAGDVSKAAPELGPLPPWAVVLSAREEAGGSSERLRQIACDAVTFEVLGSRRAVADEDENAKGERPQPPRSALEAILGQAPTAQALELEVDVEGGLLWLKEHAKPPPSPLEKALNRDGGDPRLASAWATLIASYGGAAPRSGEGRPTQGGQKSGGGWLGRVGRWLGLKPPPDTPPAEAAPVTAATLITALRERLVAEHPRIWARLVELDGAPPLSADEALVTLLGLLSRRAPLVVSSAPGLGGPLIDLRLAGVGAEAVDVQWLRRRARAQLADLGRLIDEPPAVGPLAGALGEAAEALRESPAFIDALGRDRKRLHADPPQPTLIHEAAYQAGRAIALKILGAPAGPVNLNTRFVEIPRLLSDPQAEARLSEDERLAHYAGVEARSWVAGQGPTGDWTGLLPDKANAARGRRMKKALAHRRPQVEALRDTLVERGRVDAFALRLMTQEGEGNQAALLAWRLLTLLQDEPQHGDQ